jgi:hypothetical protein
VSYTKVDALIQEPVVREGNKRRIVNHEGGGHDETHTID